MPVAANGGGTPTVNGLFYGDGDESNYYFLGEDPGRGTLYYNRLGNTLYLAVVVSNTVNDNVFGKIKGDVPLDIAYVQSAGWSGSGNKHQAKHLINSDNVELKLQCVGGDSWTWKQDYLYDADDNENPGEADWLSDPAGTDGDTTWDNAPPGLVSRSSLQWNLNNAVANNMWDVTLEGNRSGSEDWKSPDDVEWEPSNNDVTDNDYSAAATPPWYDSEHHWEWAMVYEMSIDVTDCGSNPISVRVISAHNSPSKDGTENVPICPAEGCPLPASIGDYVWHDVNMNGLQDDEEVGLPGVTVNLYKSDDTPVGSTTTSSDGLYTFTNLSPGDYYVEFVLPNNDDYSFTLQDRGSNDAVDSDADPTTGRTVVTTLLAGETDLTWDAGLHLCDIGDRVWHDQDGYGDQNGAEPGLNGVDVYLYNFDPGPDGGPGYLYKTTTISGTSQAPDGYDDGIYGFDMSALPTGDYWVWVDESTLTGQWTLTTGSNPQKVTYTGGDDFSIDFGFAPMVDLALTKTLDTLPPYTVDKEVTFSVMVTNEGGVDATGVEVKDFNWTSNLEYVRDDSGGVHQLDPDNPASGDYVVIWDVGDLLAGASRTMHITFKIIGSYDFENQAEIYACDQQDVDSTPNNGWVLVFDPPLPAHFEDDIDDAGGAPPTAVTLSSFAAKSTAGGSASPVWPGLAGLTVLAAGSLFWKKRRS